MPQGMDSLFGLIGEAVWNKLQKKSPGFTREQKMTNQGPMGTPTQDPSQYDVPYRTPYGPDMPFNRGDVGGEIFGLDDQTRKMPNGDTIPMTISNRTFMNAPALSDSIGERTGMQVSPDDVDRILSRRSIWHPDKTASEAEAYQLMREYAQQAANASANRR